MDMLRQTITNFQLCNANEGKSQGASVIATYVVDYDGSKLLHVNCTKFQQLQQKSKTIFCLIAIDDEVSLHFPGLSFVVSHVSVDSNTDIPILRSIVNSYCFCEPLCMLIKL